MVDTSDRKAESRGGTAEAPNPCYWCGGAATARLDGQDGDWTSRVECANRDGCGVRGPAHFAEDRDSAAPAAVAGWNAAFSLLASEIRRHRAGG